MKDTKNDDESWKGLDDEINRAIDMVTIQQAVDITQK